MTITGSLGSPTTTLTDTTLDIDDLVIAPKTTITITVDAVILDSTQAGTYPSQAVLSGVPPSQEPSGMLLSTPLNGLEPGPTIVRIPPPDLVVDAVDDTSLVHDPQTGDVTGTAEVVIRNAGFGEPAEGYDVTLFADANGDGVFTDGVDTVLGTQMVAPGLEVDGTETLMFDLPPGTTLDFPNQPIFAFVDSGEMINEAVEENNYGTSAASCPPFPVGGAIAPVLEWRFDTPALGHSMPMVADLNGDAIPDVVYVDADPAGGVLRVLDGRDGTETWVAPLGADNNISPAIGDIDGDGLPEVVVASVLGNLVAFEDDGTLKWVSSTTIGGFTFVTGHGLGIADLDADGTAEVYFAARVYDGPTGVQEWGFNGFNTGVAVDATQDGIAELLAGPRVYDALGAILQIVGGNGFTSSFGNFDDDPELEIVSWGSNIVVTNADDGTQLWAVPRPTGISNAPALVDIDGDGRVEILLPSQTAFFAYDDDGTVLWSVTGIGTLSELGAPTAFDLNGDGALEVMHVTETAFYIWDAASGTELYTMPWDVPGWAPTGVVVADVDADGVAEIVLNGGNGSDPTNIGGIHVLGPAAGDWGAARTIWHQDGYYRDNINDDLTVPAVPGMPWRTHNSFRVQRSACWDLAVARLTVDITDFPASVEIGLRVGNGGTEPVPVGTPVAFYDGDPSMGGVLIGTATTMGVIVPGEFENVTFSWTAPPVSGDPLTLPVYVVVDDDGTGASEIREPDEENNALGLTYELADSDGDGVLDVFDPDDDNDGVLDVDEGAATGLDPSSDEDIDGVPNYRDEDVPGFVDSNMDGVDDRVDPDLDGVPNQLDLDSDNDGVPDLVENATAALADALDGDRDGLPDDSTDTDGDGVVDVFDSAPADPDVSTSNLPVTDTDGDSIPDVYDLDADGDGIYDIVEADGDDDDGDGQVDGFSDGNGNGYDSSVDPADGGTPWATPDTDDDGDFDFQDTDSDDDRVPDATEGHDVNADGAPDVPPSGMDADGNGVDDAYDTNGTPAPLPNRDGDGLPDYRDVDDDGDTIVTHNGTNRDEDVNGDGDPTNDDSDGDGIPNYLDNNGGVSGGSLGCGVTMRGLRYADAAWLLLTVALLSRRLRRPRTRR